jgi:hypothetical protein
MPDRVHFIVSMDARGDEDQEVSRIFRLLRDWYEGRDVTVGISTIRVQYRNAQIDGSPDA